MGEATFDAYVRSQLSSLLSQLDQPYEAGIEDFQRAQSLEAEFLRAERERCEREMAAWRAEFERGYLLPVQRAWIDVWIDIEAQKAARPAIDKPLSRRARRRNRGRVRTERSRLALLNAQPIRWTWPKAGASS